MVMSAAFSLEAEANTVTVPELRFGMTVETREAGLAVIAIDDDAPVGTKLRPRDVIVSYRLLGALSRPIPVHSNDQLEDVKKLLNADKPVEIAVLRPNADDDKNPGYDQIVVALRPADLRGKTKTVEYTASVTVAEPPPPEKDPTHTLVDVYYGTDRALEKGQYTGTMDQTDSPVKLGLCRVSVPKDRRPGELPRPSWWPTEWREDPAKHVILTTVSQYDGERSFFEALSASLLKAEGKRRALVYVHGYNNDFEEAALRTAQLHYDLGFPGISCFFSWPSDGTFSGYKADEEDIQVAMPHIRDFIASIENRPDIDEIFVLAHSMGNRGVTTALKELVANGGGKKIRELILAAPDINATVFNKQIAPNLAKHIPRITIYASNRDRPLAASQWISGYARAGEMGSDGLPFVTPLRNLDVCDASIADSDFWGHSVYGDSPTVLNDLWELIVTSKNADGRRMLSPVNSSAGRFYRLKTR